jgi:hypothetical protein
METGCAGSIRSQSDVIFKHPFNMIVGGASGSGKTEWVCTFLENYSELITPPIHHVLYCYGVYNKNVPRMESMGVETQFGLPTEKVIRERSKPLLLILDDLMMEAKSDFLDLLFTRGSHHWGVSIVFITQNMFEKSLKTARNNSHYLVLLRNPSGQLQIRNLGTQLFPRNLAYFMEAYKDATAGNFGYLVVDMHPASPDYIRLRTEIFPDDAQVLYFPKNT